MFFIDGRVMTSEILSELEELGSEETIEKLKKLGAKGKMYGVSEEDLKKLARKVKREYDTEHPEFFQAEVIKLWSTGILDARLLAIRLIYPELVRTSVLQKWVVDINFFHLANQFVSELVLKTDHAEEMAKKWLTSKKEYILRCGFDIVRYSLEKNIELFDQAFLIEVFKMIAMNIKSVPNRAKESMILTLIAIGKHREDLKKACIELAARIGPIKIKVGDNLDKEYSAYDELTEKKE